MTTFKGFARVLRSKRVPTEDGRGVTSRVVGEEQGDVVLEIDVHRLIKLLGEKAMCNRSHKSKALGGLITARASNLRMVKS